MIEFRTNQHEKKSVSVRLIFEGAEHGFVYPHVAHAFVLDARKSLLLLSAQGFRLALLLLSKSYGAHPFACRIAQDGDDRRVLWQRRVPEESRAYLCFFGVLRGLNNVPVKSQSVSEKVALLILDGANL